MNELLANFCIYRNLRIIGQYFLPPKLLVSSYNLYRPIYIIFGMGEWGAGFFLKRGLNFY